MREPTSPSPGCQKEELPLLHPSMSVDTGKLRLCEIYCAEEVHSISRGMCNSCAHPGDDMYLLKNKIL